MENFRIEKYNWKKKEKHNIPKASRKKIIEQI